MTTRMKVFLLGAAIAVIALTIVTIESARQPTVAKQKPTAAVKKPRALLFPSLPVEPKPAEQPAEKAAAAPAPPEKPPGPHELFSDSYEYASAIAETPEFQTFATGAALNPEQQRQVSHILALYYMDDASLQNMNTDDAAKLASMRRQLLVHMHVRVRAKIPQAFEMFEQSKLLPPVEPEPAKTAGPT